MQGGNEEHGGTYYCPQSTGCGEDCELHTRRQGQNHSQLCSFQMAVRVDR